MTADNLELAKGFEAVSTQQAEPLTVSDLEPLATGGVKHLALRKVGADNIDLEAAAKYGITVANVPAYSSRAIAENGLTGGHVPLAQVGLLPPEDGAEMYHPMGARVIGYDPV